MSDKRRKPEIFTPDDPRVRIDYAQPEIEARMNLNDVLDTASLPDVVPAGGKPKRSWLRWGWMFWSASAGLVLLGLGLSVLNLIRDLFAHSQSLGVLGLGLAGIAALAFTVVAVREIISIARLAAVDATRERALEAIASDDRTKGQEVVAELLTLTRKIPRLARGRTHLEMHRGDIIDGRDLVRLAEQELMAPLDAEARRMIGAAATRVSLVTAVSPRASVDMIFVLVNALGLIRKLSTLYGARPGMLGLIRLVRHTVAHLAFTGGMAATDSLIQQVVGHGVAAKLSAKLGEGVLNGLLTARLGLAALDVTRPLPFTTLPRPTLNDLAGGLLRRAEKEEAATGPGAKPRS